MEVKEHRRVLTGKNINHKKVKLRVDFLPKITEAYNQLSFHFLDPNFKIGLKFGSYNIQHRVTFGRYKLPLIVRLA